MRRRVGLIAGGLAAALLLAPVCPGLAEPAADMPDVKAPVVFLLDLGTGTVLFDRRSEAAIEPGVLVQLAVAAVADDALRHGEVTPDTVYRISDDAWRRGGAPSRGPSLQAVPRSRISVGDLLRGLAVDNAVDAAITLAVGVAGSEDAYVARMNRLAATLGLRRTTFVSVTGARDQHQTTTARDLAALARHLIDDPATYARYAGSAMVWNRLRQRNHNRVLDAAPGTDGLAEVQTGAGWALVASARRGERRLLLVLYGEPTQAAATLEGAGLLEWGFSAFEVRHLFAAGQTVGDAQVFGGERPSVRLAVGSPVTMMVRHGASEVRAEVVYQGPVQAPVLTGTPVGVLRLRSTVSVPEPPREGAARAASPAKTVQAGAAASEARPSGASPAALSSSTPLVTLEVPVAAAEDVGTGTLVQRALGATIELGVGLVRAAPVLR